MKPTSSESPPHVAFPAKDTTPFEPETETVVSGGNVRCDAVSRFSNIMPKRLGQGKAMRLLLNNVAN